MPEAGRKPGGGVMKHDHQFVHGSHVIYYPITDTELVIQSVEHVRTICNPWGES